jgi:hypothetical protein
MGELHSTTILQLHLACQRLYQIKIILLEAVHFMLNMGIFFLFCFFLIFSVFWSEHLTQRDLEQ